MRCFLRSALFMPRRDGFAPFDKTCGFPRSFLIKRYDRLMYSAQLSEKKSSSHALVRHGFQFPPQGVDTDPQVLGGAFAVAGTFFQFIGDNFLLQLFQTLPQSA